MIHLSLLGHTERIYHDDTFFPDEFARRGYSPLYGQWRTYDALVTGNAGIVVNTYPTGSGKTKAALLYLHELRRKPPTRANCLFIAPTNELLEQHARDIETFCDTNKLGYQVLRLTHAYIDEYAEVVAQLAPDMTRRAARLDKVLENPRVLLDPQSDDASQQRPYVLVTNPDIFYYAVYNGYGRNEEKNLMLRFLSGFDYVVIDEFHYYNPKQLANFLFFLSVWEHYDFFTHKNEAKVCLLSATPNPYVRAYLGTLKTTVAEIGPDNEPEQVDGETSVTPSLAPVELDIFAQSEVGDEGLSAIVKSRMSELRQWLDTDKQGAIISSVLWRINLAYYLLKQSSIPIHRFARLTGAEQRQARAAATHCDLILATPTVDLGYNFERTDKFRQSIDFLFFDAAFVDEFIQRLGRAGRVLGKPVNTIPSHAFAVLSDDLVRVLTPLEGRLITRDELRATLKEGVRAGMLKERNTLFDYVATGAIEEAFLPILRLRQMAGSTALDDIRELYERFRALLNGSDRFSFTRLEITTRQFVKERQVFKDAPTDTQELVKYVLKMPEDMGVRLWLWSKARQEPPARVLQQAKDSVGKPEAPLRREFVEWMQKAQMEYAVREASFSFRESFEEPLARIYDQDYLISSAKVVDYGLFHIISNCDVEVISAAQWAELSGFLPSLANTERVAVYYLVRSLREPAQRLRLQFRLYASQERRLWESDHACKMTALLGLELDAEPAQLPSAVIDAVKHRFVPAFLAPKSSRIGGQLIGVAQSQGFRFYDITVIFPGGAPSEYQLLLGTCALLAAAHLRQASAIYHKQQEKEFNDPIWC